MASAFLSPTFIIGSVRIGTVEGASCINFGNNYPSGFVSSKKHNQGFGNIHGEGHQLRDGRTVLNDSDILDMFNHDAETVPEWVKELTGEAAAKASQTSRF